MGHAFSQLYLLKSTQIPAKQAWFLLPSLPAFTCRWLPFLSAPHHLTPACPCPHLFLFFCAGMEPRASGIPSLYPVTASPPPAPFPEKASVMLY